MMTPDEHARAELTQATAHINLARDMLAGLFTDDHDVPPAHRPGPDRITDLLTATRDATAALLAATGQLRNLMLVGPNPDTKLHADAGWEPDSCAMLARRTLTQAEQALRQAREATADAHGHAARIHAL